MGESSRMLDVPFSAPAIIGPPSARDSATTRRKCHGANHGANGFASLGVNVTPSVSINWMTPKIQLLP